MPAIGDLVRTQREAVQLSRRDLAQRSGLTRSGVQLIEDGRRTDPRASTVVALARGLGCDPTTLLAPFAISDA